MATNGNSGRSLCADSECKSDLSNKNEKEAEIETCHAVGNISVDYQLGFSSVEIFTRMMENEQEIIFSPTSWYLRYRRHLVDWMCQLGEEFNLNGATMHVAVAYLDRYLARVYVDDSNIQIVAVACLLIAGKNEEPEEIVPLARDMSPYVNGRLTASLLVQTELTILQELEWKLRAFTPMHFIGYYSTKGLLFEQDEIFGKKVIVKVARYVLKHAEFFADLSLQEYSFQQFPPSIMASACVMAARRVLRINPLWRSELEQVTLYSQSDIEPCFQYLYTHYEKTFQSKETNGSNESPISVQESTQ